MLTIEVVKTDPKKADPVIVSFEKTIPSLDKFNSESEDCLQISLQSKHSTKSKLVMENEKFYLQGKNFGETSK
jgi:hypothetical protein